MSIQTHNYIAVTMDMTNGVSSFGKHWERVVDQYAIPFGHFCIKLVYAAYANFTFFNLIIFLIKCVPMAIYMQKFIKNTYILSRERIRQKQSELEDIQLQIQIVNTKLCCREAEFVEREEQLRRSAEKLRSVRAQVRQIIAEDDTLRPYLNQEAAWGDDFHLQFNNSPEEEYKFIEELLKGMKCETMASPEVEKEKPICGENCEPRSPENSMYSASDADGNQDCRVKIVKVTNVYRVAFLKHFIKQKRLWRANRNALLKKKMNNIKKQLNDWQKTLNMVINNKMSLLNMDSQRIIIASEEAMGDGSRANLRDSSDSDTDFINSSDNFFDDYNSNWHQNQYSSFPTDGYDDTVLENGSAYDTTKYDDKYNCQITLIKGNELSVLPEETKSQIEIEDLTPEPCF